MDVKYIMITVILVAIAFTVGCISIQCIEVPAPDGEVNLKVKSLTLYGLWIPGPEPPKVKYSKVHIEGILNNREVFKINIKNNFAPDYNPLDRCDVVWCADSKLFAVATPFDLLIYNRNGIEINKYALDLKERISTIHWGKNWKTLFIVVKESEEPLNCPNAIFEPNKLRLMSVSVYDKEWKTIYTKRLPDSTMSDFFIGNSLGHKQSGGELQEISPESRWFLYSDGKRILFYDLMKGKDGFLFDPPGSLYGIWWLNKDCVLFAYLLSDNNTNKYICYNITSGRQSDLSQKIKALSSEERYKKEWYKSIFCPLYQQFIGK